MFDVFPTETLFSSIVIAVEWQPPENNICAERAIDESQKFPWPRQHKNIKGTENNVEIDCENNQELNELNNISTKMTYPEIIHSDDFVLICPY